MNRRTAVLFLAALPLALSGCARLRASRLNPANWFEGANQGDTTGTTTPAEISDGRLLVETVTDLTIEEAPGGAIVRATGLPRTQGWWKAELKSGTRGRPDADGVLTYRFLVFPPLTDTPVSTPRSREITVAVFLSDIRLASIRKIVVQGEKNSLASAR